MALRGERKTIEKKHLSFLADYIGKKTLRTVDFAPLLNEPDNAQSKLEEFNSVM